MTSDADEKRIEELFAQAKDLGEDEQAAFLTEPCRDDPPEVRQAVEKLLAADRRQAAIRRLDAAPLQAGAVRLNCPHCHNPIELVVDRQEEVVCPSCGSSFHLDAGRTQTWSKDKLPTLGKFTLLSPLGFGAFGTVYKAFDSELKRAVALKIPRSGTLAGEEDADRFFREARNAAQLRHSGIVPVFEVGRSEQFPYIVSELVEGITLADALTGRRFGFREAAQLVQKLAEALDYSHKQGVVHRDLKPSNIMLSVNDTPRIMDFGLAKREAGEITMTMDGHVLGTPAYMSPEQASGKAHEVDGRSDVYSLGVILFELLTGELPFRGNPRMLLHQVLHNEPRTPRSLNDRVPRDLETICLKAMAKEPKRRYQTAGEFGEDLGQYLNGEPIHARPVGRVERAWRWCKRQPVVAGLLAAVVLTLATGTVVSAVFAVRASEREADAVEARNAETKAASEARESNADTQAYAAFLVDHVLATARPEGEEGGLGVNVTVREALIAAEAKIDEVFVDGAELTLRKGLGATWFALGEFEKAATNRERVRAILEQSLGADHPETLASMEDLAISFDALGRYSEALKLREKALARRKAMFGPDHAYTLTSMSKIAVSYTNLGRHVDALRLREATLALRKTTLLPDHRDTLQSMHDLAISYTNVGRHADAVKLNDETLALRKTNLGPHHRETLASMHNLAVGYSRLGRHADAVKLDEVTLALRKEKLGPNHSDTLASMHNLAIGYERSGRLAEALKLREEILALRKSKLGADHAETLSSMENLAILYEDAAALKIREETLALQKSKYGVDHRDTLTSMRNLAISYSRLGRYADAARLYEEVVALRKDELGLDDRDTLALAAAYRGNGQPERANSLFGEIITTQLAKLSDEISADDWKRLSERGNLHARAGQWKEAAADFAAAIRAQPENDWIRFQSAGLWLMLDDTAAYRRHCREMLDRFRQTDNPVAAERTAKACLLVPGAVDDIATLARLADRAITFGTERDQFYGFYLLARGLVHYRAGEFARAVERLEESVKFGSPSIECDGPAYLVLAMAHHRLRHANEASQALAEAHKLIDVPRWPTINSTDRGAGWQDVIIIHILRREAEALLKETEGKAVK